MRALVERKAADLTALLEELRAVLSAGPDLADDITAAVCPLIEETSCDVRWVGSLARPSRARRPASVKASGRSSSNTPSRLSSSS